MFTCSRCGAGFESKGNANIPQAFQCPKCGGALVAGGKQVFADSPMQGGGAQPVRQSGGSSAGLIIALVLGGVTVVMVGLVVAGMVAFFVLARSASSRATAISASYDSSSAYGDSASQYPEPAIELTPDSTGSGTTSPSSPAPPPLAAESVPHEIRFHIENSSWNPSTVSLSSDGRWLAVGYLDQRVEIYDVQQGQKVAEEKNATVSGAVAQIVFSPDGTRLLVLGETKGGQLWQVSEAGELTDVGNLSEAPSGMTFAFVDAASSRVVIGTKANRLACWDLATGAIVWEQTNFEQPLMAGVAPAGEANFTVTDLGTLFEIDRGTGEVVSQRALPRKPRKAEAQFSANGKRLVAYDQSVVTTFDTESLEAIATAKPAEMLWSLAVSPDGDTIYAGGQARVHVFDATDGRKSRHHSVAR